MLNVKNVAVVENIESYNKIMCKFAEAVYQKVASQRYGIDFCCSANLIDLSLQVEKLKLNDICLNSK